VLDGLRVARKRVLRLMREHALLSPYRQRSRPAEVHDRRITTDAPNLM
jgi:putative transposase